MKDVSGYFVIRVLEAPNSSTPHLGAAELKEGLGSNALKANTRCGNNGREDSVQGALSFVRSLKHGLDSGMRPAQKSIQEMFAKKLLCHIP